MSHLDEGVLSAYLDGALDAVYGTVEAARLRQHVASCDHCALRLKEEQSLRATASAILSGADPALETLPALEEMKIAAERRSAAPSAATGRRTMAWAASIMIALGTGWMARQITTPSPPFSSSISDEAPVSVSGQRQLSPSEQPSTTGRTEEISSSATDRARELGPTRRLDEDRVAQTARSEVAPDVERDAVPVPEVDATEVPVAVTAEAPIVAATEALTGATAEAPTVAATEALTGATAEAPTVTTAEAAGVGTANARKMEMSAGGVAMDMLDASGAGLPRTDGSALAVPGLEILAVQVLPRGGITGTLRVLQALDGGEVLEVLRLPPGVEPSELTPLPDGHSEWVSRREGGWVVLRAPIESDSLAVLGGRLNGGG